ncbi:hypothetical protein CMO89_00940 [Candidatus Woesearchaeota archaeon]|nr:hypothetical protein [Candidatus Woesearchaeota archaeon]|tara:strand:+ start:742 stop:1233 length:492 start_codon:yes stop_codon:yes gene_type:complete
MVLIRKANVKDISSIVKLWEEFMKDHDKIVLERNERLRLYTPRKKNAADNYRAFITEQLKSRKGAIFFAEVDDNIIGFTLVIIKDEIPVFKIEKIGYISDLFVKKEHRGKGISSQLMDKSIKWLKKNNMNHISIGLYVDNEFAHSVYKKKGFFDYKIEMRREI